MEKNTTVISLDVYNGLRDFMKKAEEKDTVLVTYPALGYVDSRRTYNPQKSYQAITKDKTIKDLVEANEEFKTQNDALVKRNNELETLKDKPKDKIILVNDIKKMSLRKFYKWKKQNS